MLKQLYPAVMVLLLLTLITGVCYPLLVTGIAQLVFPAASNGSIITRDGKAFGSELIGQSFSNPRYFWSRLSATGPNAYNAGASSGSNFGPLNPALIDAVNKRIKELKDADPQKAGPIPVDLVTASGSGLDPHISEAAALYQMGRVARTRNMTEESLRSLLKQFTEGRQFGFMGEPRVNVLKLNIALDELQTIPGGK